MTRRRAPGSLWSMATAEFLGTGFLLMAIVGSGAMVESLTTDVGLQLIQNAFATAAVLTALILTFGAVSGAHFNPAVTLVARLLGRVDSRTALVFVLVQLLGAATGVVVANVMFERGLIAVSTRSRSGDHLLVAEAVATLGLILVIHGVSRAHREAVTAAAVGAYIAGAFAFTSSTSFANPAVTVARTLSDTFAGIDPGSAPAFVGVQLAVAALAAPIVLVLFGPVPAASPTDLGGPDYPVGSVTWPMNRIVPETRSRMK